MIIFLTCLLFSNDEPFSLFSFDCLNELMVNQDKEKDIERIILEAKLCSIIFRHSVNDEQMKSQFMDNIFQMIGDNNNLDLLSGMLYFSFIENSDETL